MPLILLSRACSSHRSLGDPEWLRMREHDAPTDVPRNIAVGAGMFVGPPCISEVELRNGVHFIERIAYGTVYFDEEDEDEKMKEEGWAMLGKEHFHLVSAFSDSTRHKLPTHLKTCLEFRSHRPTHGNVVTSRFRLKSLGPASRHTGCTLLSRSSSATRKHMPYALLNLHSHPSRPATFPSPVPTLQAASRKEVLK